MKSKIIALTLALILTTALVVNTTYAWLMDAEASSGNTFTAGTLEIKACPDAGDSQNSSMFNRTSIEAEAGNGTADVNDAGLWHPGKTVTQRLNVYNSGSLDARLYLVGAQIISIDGGNPEADTELSALFSKSMQVKIFVADHPELVLYMGSLYDLLEVKNCINMPEIPASDSLKPLQSMVQLDYEVTMSEDAGEELEGITANITFTIYAEQADKRM